MLDYFLTIVANRNLTALLYTTLRHSGLLPRRSEALNHCKLQQWKLVGGG